MAEIFIEIGGFKYPVNKKQIFELASSGGINSNTKLWYNGRETSCGKIRGIHFEPVRTDPAASSLQFESGLTGSNNPPSLASIMNARQQASTVSNQFDFSDFVSNNPVENNPVNPSVSTSNLIENSDAINLASAGANNSNTFFSPDPNSSVQKMPVPENINPIAFDTENSGANDSDSPKINLENCNSDDIGEEDPDFDNLFFESLDPVPVHVDNKTENKIKFWVSTLSILSMLVLAVGIFIFVRQNQSEKFEEPDIPIAMKEELIKISENVQKSAEQNSSEKETIGEDGVNEDEIATKKIDFQGKFLLDSFDLKEETLPSNFKGHDPQEIYRTLTEKFKKKDKYETEDQYRERIKTAQSEKLFGNIGHDSLFACQGHIRLFNYDAEKQQAGVMLCNIISFPYTYKTSYTVELPDIIESSETYIARNSAGTQREISDTLTIEYRLDYIPKESVKFPVDIETTTFIPFDLDPKTAKELEKKLKFLTIFQIKPFTDNEGNIYYTKNEYRRTVPTFSSPYDSSWFKRTINIENPSFIIYDELTGNIFKKFTLDELIQLAQNSEQNKKQLTEQKENEKEDKKQSKPTDLTASSRAKKSEADFAKINRSNIIVPDDIFDLKEALDLVYPDGSITIKPGTYNIIHTLKIDKNVTITGSTQNPEEVVLKGGSTLLTVSAPYAKLSNLALVCEQNEFASLDVTAGKPFFINCMFQSNAGKGVTVSGKETDPNFVKCNFSYCLKGGLFIEKDGKGSFQSCTFNDNKPFAIGIRSNGNPVIENCRIFGNETGIAIDATGNGTFRGNKLNDNTKNNWLIHKEAGKIVREKNNPNQ